MSYADPQSWTDVDAGGNALDWSNRDNKLTYPAYEMIRKAILERCQVVGLSLPAALSSRSDGTIYDGWFDAAQATITSLIPLFVNHTDSGGTWNDTAPAAFAPYWTESALLSDIGDARLSTGIPLAAWSKQQYEILNRLVWVKNQQSAVLQRERGWYRLGNSFLGDPGGGSWGAAVVEWDGGSWLYISEPDSSEIRQIGKRELNGGIENYWTVEAFAPEFTGLVSTPSSYIPHGQVYDVDGYMLFDFDPEFSPSIEYDSGEFGITRGNLGLMASETSAVFASPYTWGKVDSYSISIPTTTDVYRGYRMQRDSIFLVAKCNVPGGFQFQ